MRRDVYKRLGCVFLAAITAFGGSMTACPSTTAQAREGREAVAGKADGREVNFNMGWKFFLEQEESLQAEGVLFDDSAWEEIQVPHDFSITQEFSNDYEAESGFLPGGTGWYRKSAVFPAEYAGRTVTLNFDGVYSSAYVYVNGSKVGEHHYGYTNFSFDISDLIICDGKTENVIAVKAVNQIPSSRWYSGSGIYRDVTLTVTQPLHVAMDGVYVTTPELERQKDGDVTVHIQTVAQNDSETAADVSVRTTVQDASGAVASKSAAEDTIAIAAGEALKTEQEVTVNRPKLWDCEDPNLYYVKTEVLSDGKVVDECLTEFGFRTISYSADTGFALNGKNIKMKGVCMHHDQGALGAAAYRDAVYRQVEKLKEMGCNAIRSSHNAPGRVLLEACNELGMLVMDEVYDGWSYPKNENNHDFSEYFNETLGEGNALIGGRADEKWVEFALKSMIHRDKNDPCVVMWSIGNELNFGAPSTTAEYVVKEYTDNAKKMVEWIQSIDPTKPITCGDNRANFGDTADYRTKIDEILVNAGGVAGLNYSPHNYVSNHNRQPDWPIVGSETVSSINSRGVYSTTGKIAEKGNYQCTAYDTSCVSWGQLARQGWLPVISNDFMMGTFVWTGFDYIGEPTDWNGTKPGSVSGDPKAIPNSSYFGIIDTAGFPKDSFYFYSSQWKEDQTTLHLVPGCWNKEDLALDGAQTVRVDVYANAAEVELLLNGEVIGTATRESIETPAGYEYGMYRTVSNDLEKCSAGNSASNTDYSNMAAQFRVKYEEGTLSARAYDENGVEITDTLGVKEVKTNSDRGSSLNVTPEKAAIDADGESLAYIAVDVLDQNGEFASQADSRIRFTLTGYGEIVGVDNGNPSTIDKYQQKSVLLNKKNAVIDAFSGKALVIVRSTEKAGGFSLKAESDGMQTKTVFVDTVGEQKGDAFVKEYSLLTEYNVDMGTKPAFQSKASVVKSDGTKLYASVIWDEVGQDIYGKPGDYSVKGELVCGAERIPVMAALHVNPVFAAAQNCSKAAPAGSAFALPKTAPGVLTDGTLYGEYPVVWKDVPESAPSEPGKTVVIQGTATISDRVSFPVTMTLRAAEYTTDEPKNIAPEYASLTETCAPASDNLLSIVDGIKNLSETQGGGDATNKRWTNWNSALLNSSPAIIFQWDEMHSVQKIDVYYYSDEAVKIPKGVTLRASRDGESFFDMKADASDIDVSNNNKATYVLEQPQSLTALRIEPIASDEYTDASKYVGMIECEIYDSGVRYEDSGSALLGELTVNGASVTGFESGTFHADGYSMKIDGRIAAAKVQAKPLDNAAVTVVSADKAGVVRILVQSEDGSKLHAYELRLQSDEEQAVAELKPQIEKAIEDAGKKVQGKYTAESWAAFQRAYATLCELEAKDDAPLKEIQAAMSALQAAMKGLAELGGGTQEETPSPAVGKKYNDDGKKAEYKILTSTKSGGTAAFVKPLKKTGKKFTVGPTVQILGITYKVTKIEKNAFKNWKALKEVTVGPNVTDIGASAFEGCKSLKKITIKSKSLKSVGKKAFKGIYKKAKIMVPKAKYRAYKKRLKGKGQKPGVTIKKS